MVDKIKGEEHVYRNGLFASRYQQKNAAQS